MKPRVQLSVSAVTLAVAAYVGGRSTGPLPALGPFLDPVHGVWGVASTAALPSRADVILSGLTHEVRVAYDDRWVPHIRATSELDAYRAQGWVVARDRLFQLELQARATAGRLGELAGASALGLDRQARGLGLARAAERAWSELEKERPDLAALLEAYADGVNGYIRSLDRRAWPLEYHLLGAAPMRWEPVHTLYLLKRMGWTLAYSSDELRRTAAAARVGREAAAALFPANSPIQEPIEPHVGTRFTRVPIPPPGAPDPDAHDQMETIAALLGPIQRSEGDDGSVLGSNNWAVGPSRSATGRPILAGDPHLQLTLPSIFYELHLEVAGTLDVYGATLVGTPGVVIGFNRDVAWSFTNSGADVLDFYREQLDDGDAPRRYLVDGAWRDLEMRIEEYRGPGGEVLLTDTLFHTHRGPLRLSDGPPLSLRWSVLDGHGEVDAMVRIIRARSVGAWLEATAGWYAPIQNGLVADRHGSIAIRAPGFYPERAEGTTGAWLYDGTTSASDWTGRLGRVPEAVDPAQGFLASANQQPVDPEVDSTFLGASWPAPWRALTINRLLRGKEKHTADDMATYQTYPSSARAEAMVPAFVDAADAVGRSGRASTPLVEAAAALRDWDLRYDLEGTRAVLFEAAMSEMAARLWDELDGEEGRPVAIPGTVVAWALLAQPESPWWDDRSTEEVETRDPLLAASLEAAFERLREELGPLGPAWRWGAHRHSRVGHLLGIEALSRSGLPVQGGPGLLNPSAGDGGHGASWRMVVELGDVPRARGTYPGGQSANPVSAAYDDRLDSWVAGELTDLRFPAPEGSLESEGLVRARLTLRPEGGP